VQPAAVHVNVKSLVLLGGGTVNFAAIDPGS
jgi:hypothetical protein